jgi:branched-subunit amino acid aminotransferase/4-amino-4-deoxychorismate lyase
MGAAADVEAVAVIDGTTVPLAEAVLALTDEGVARGDGAFETVGVWDGRPFRLDAHLERLTASLRAIRLPPPDTAVLQRWVREVCEGLTQDFAIRMFVTASGTHIVTRTPQPVRTPPQRLSPQPAPWIRPRGTYGPSGAKTMSYSPNMAATRAAVAEGADDALLVSLEGYVLEGPTFFVGWVRDGVLFTPDVGLGLVDSISRRTLTELAVTGGRDVEQGRYPLSELAHASEVLLCSSVRPVIAVRAVGEHTFDGPTPVADALRDALDGRRRGR